MAVPQKKKGEIKIKLCQSAVTGVAKSGEMLRIIAIRILKL
ncbi:hypothetical protein [Thermosynechococcus sp. B1]|nr:hypothetical protein [Thermosynechococcus sp. B1]